MYQDEYAVSSLYSGLSARMREKARKIWQQQKVDKLVEANRDAFEKLCDERRMPRRVRDIIDNICKSYGVCPASMLRRCGKRVYVRARHEALYFIKKDKPERSSCIIASWFDIDPTSAMHGIAAHARRNGLQPLVGYDHERHNRAARERYARLKDMAA